MTHRESGWWSDDPIQAPAQERLGRTSFVDRVVRLLDEIAGQPSSSVIALVGPWGSGKTSTANLVLEKLDRGRWGVARLNPWALGSADAVVSELLGTIASALPENAAGMKAKEKLRKYAAAGAPLLSMIPTFGAAMEKMATAALAPGDENTVQAHFERVSKALGELQQPVLVFVDDVDRLHPEELTSLFRAVRVLGRLPYVHYTVAYDQRTIVDLLKATAIARDDESRALAFLEKIVTVPIDQPAIREEKSAELVNDGLESLFADLHIKPTGQQRERLATEWEQLLADDLTQPRSIRRLIAQLRIYVPLVGAGDVDVVDYLATTHLRLSYPRLYQALRADRRILTAQGTHADRQRLERWSNGSAVEAAGVAETRRGPLQSAVQRLFPASSEAPPVTPRWCGADDPDYVDSYFAFGPGDKEASNADLLALLHDWAALEALPPDLEPAFRPDPADRQACALSASLIRRLARLAGELDAHDAGRLLPLATRLLPMPLGVLQNLGRPAEAMEFLLTQLILAADEVDARDLLDAAHERGTRAFLSFLNAVPPASADPGRKTALADVAAETAWHAFLDNVRAGDAAPDEPTDLLFLRIERLIGSRRANALLVEAVGDGVDLGDLAARFVLVDDLDKEIGPVIRHFDGRMLARRIGREHLRHHRAALEPVAADEVRTPTGIGWAERRQHAKADLAEYIDSYASHHLPTLPADVPDPFGSGSRFHVVDGPSEPPVLQLTVSVVTPARKVPLGNTPPAPGPSGDQREDVIRADLDASRLSEILRGFEAAGRPLSFTGWRVADPTDGRSVTRLTAAPPRNQASAPGASSGQFLAGALVRTGTDDGRTFLWADFAVGIWASENRSPQPSEKRGEEQRRLTTLTLAEMHALVAALVLTAVRSARTLCRRLAPGSNWTSSTFKLTGEAGGGVDQALHLESLTRVGHGSGSGAHSGIVGVAGADYESLETKADEWALAFVAEWLMRAGYRGFEDALRELSNERPAREQNTPS